jgi:hypothetical protein
VDWRELAGPWQDGLPGDPAADNAEAVQEQRAREAALLESVRAGSVPGAERILGDAAARVASGANSCLEAAVWSVTYRDGYVQGRRDGLSGAGSGAAVGSEGYRAGYARGYRWGSDHRWPSATPGCLRDF